MSEEDSIPRVKKVLVCLGDRKREVIFTADIMGAVRSSFSDVLLAAHDGRPAKFILQLKNEEWGGDFLDVADESEVPDRSVLKVIPSNEVESQELVDEV